jgi:hypothetical protein
VIPDREKVNVLADVVPDVGVLVPDLLVEPGGNFLDPVLAPPIGFGNFPPNPGSPSRTPDTNVISSPVVPDGSISR